MSVHSLEPQILDSPRRPRRSTQAIIFWGPTGAAILSIAACVGSTYWSRWHLTQALQDANVKPADIQYVEQMLRSQLNLELVTLGAIWVIGTILVTSGQRRWRKGLDELILAARHLGDGLPPKPVPVGKRDELGYLQAVFNQMAGRLVAQRRALEEANESLEQRIKERTSQLEEALARLDQLASTDFLTGLDNRRAFEDILERFFQAAQRYQHDLSCVMIDLDGFKAVNDTMGHKAGDALLVLAAKVLKDNRRGSDCVARLGGDEFAVLLPHTSEDEAATLADRLRQQFEQAAGEKTAEWGHRMAVSMSLGLASRIPHQPRSGEELLNQADHALYVAKARGKGLLSRHQLPPATPVNAPSPASP